MLIIVDSDSLVYNIGFGAEDRVAAIAISRLDYKINSIAKRCEATDSKFYLTSQDKSNYRYEIANDYKANRVKLHKPRHYHSLRDHLIRRYNAEVVNGMEADDACAIAFNPPTGKILAHVDKDLNQCPGSHYNFVKDTHYEVTELEALRFFYKQILIGDRSDNIQGLAGIGQVKAGQHLDHIDNEAEMYQVVLDLFKTKHPEDYKERVLKAGQLLKILRKEEEPLWQGITKTDTAQDLSEQ